MWPLVTASCPLGLREAGPALDAGQRVLDRRRRRAPLPGAGDPLHTARVVRNSAWILEDARDEVWSSGPIRFCAVVRAAHLLGCSGQCSLARLYPITQHSRALQ